MASPVRTYQSELHDKLGFFATWLPGEPIEIGDVGVFEGGRFRRMTSLEELGIASETAAIGATLDVQYTSTRGTAVNVPASAGVAGVATAEVTVDFSSSGAFLFHANGLQVHRLENRMAAAKAILEAHRRKAWEPEWLLVESLYAAKSATVVISEDSAAQLVLAASVAGPIGGLSLSDPKLGLKVVSTRGRLFHAVGAEGLRPLYSCLRVKDPLFGEPQVQPVRSARGIEAAAELVRPAIGDLLDA
ncbi:hypothetical protein [Tahibacter soli]|uniref:Uncharacterized protein n=1 Tax=Tahibacter soli TaxID=2983605 RepID=A0A9X3YMT5_9GAMM|nr:hypothetical protein [Tahibacter soli]MDC8014150.1 hypothetical protein [Tahibacter soli]